MKQTIANYSFSASAKTIALTDYTYLFLEHLYLIVDVTTNTILYNFADSTVGTVSINGNIITFTKSNAGLNDTDKLMIIYDPTNPYLPVEDEDTSDPLTHDLLQAVCRRLDYILLALQKDYPLEDGYGLDGD